MERGRERKGERENGRHKDSKKRREQEEGRGRDSRLYLSGAHMREAAALDTFTIVLMRRTLVAI